MTQLPLPTVSIVIPVFNQWKYTAACLEALRRTCTPEIPVEVIVIDNASTDETAVELADWKMRWAALRTERLAVNTGFSPACNRGAELSRGEFILFLNNDTEPDPGWLAPLLDEVRKPQVGLAGPKLLFPERTLINHAGYVYGRGLFYGIYDSFAADFPGANKPRSYQALLGACVIVRRELFFAVGRFSLDALEDIDLCLKIRERGLECRYVPASVVIHHGSVTLRLSPPGSFPVTSNQGFTSYWQNRPIAIDDYYWLVEDGVWPAPPADGSDRSAAELASDSMRLIVQAQRTVFDGAVLDGLKQIEAGLKIWPLNPMGYVAWCSLLHRLGRTLDVIDALGRLEQFSFYPDVIEDLKPVLQKTLPLETLQALGIDPLKP